MRVLVCGGRNYNDRHHVWREMAAVHSERGPITCVIEGGSWGADESAARWAVANRIPHLRFPADWQKHGRGGGPIRNQRMVEEGRPDLVMAFPGGKGTADMIRRAQAAGVKVIDYAPTRELA